MIRRKNALFAHFQGKLVKLKIFQAQCRLCYLILIFLITKKIYQKQTKIQHFFFQKNNLKKKVIPAITDICTGGHGKYQLLGSGVNISYYLHWGEFFGYCSKYEGMQISLSNLAHTCILVL